jgi:hypothetical protein
MSQSRENYTNVTHRVLTGRHYHLSGRSCNLASNTVQNDDTCMRHFQGLLEAQKLDWVNLQSDNESGEKEP